MKFKPGDRVRLKAGLRKKRLWNPQIKGNTAFGTVTRIKVRGKVIVLYIRPDNREKAVSIPDEFVDLVCRQPANVYADWIEEQGKPGWQEVADALRKAFPME